MTRPPGRRWPGRAAGVVASTALVASLTGCGSDARRCEELYVGAIGAVEGVASVEADCSLQFGGGWQRVDVHLATDDVAEATTIRESALRALAAQDEIDASWSVPRAYYFHDGSSAVGDMPGTGFGTVGDVRDAGDG